MGLNCATGPREMAEHVRWLAENWEGPITVQPNAGLPELVDGKTRYPLTPVEMTKWLERFVAEDGVNLIGGCCGTDAGPYPARSTRMLRARSADELASRADQAHAQVGRRRSPRSMARCRCARKTRICRSASAATPTAASKFRELQEKGDWQGCVDMGREQVREASHTLDVCTAFVGRDEVKEMAEVVSPHARLRATRRW